MRKLFKGFKKENTTKELRRVMLSTLICVVVCVSILMGGTLAWLYTSVEVGGNVIEVDVPDVGVIVAPVGVNTLDLLPLVNDTQNLPPTEKYTVELSIEDTADDLGKQRNPVYVQVSFVSNWDEIHRFYVLLNAANNYQFTIQALSFSLNVPETADTEEGLENAPDTVEMRVDASWDVPPEDSQVLSGTGVESVVVGVQIETTPTPEPSESPAPSESPEPSESAEPSATPGEETEDPDVSDAPEATTEAESTETPLPTDTEEPAETSSVQDDIDNASQIIDDVQNLIPVGE